MDHQSELPTETVKAVHFGVYTSEEVRNMSVKELTEPSLLDALNNPVPGGLYDEAMGPLNERASCKTCGQKYFSCPGHCGHIELVSPVYNPLLFNLMYKIVQRTCFSCGHFKAEAVMVERCVSQLELILKGDMVGAKELGSVSSSESVHPEDGEGHPHALCSTVPSGVKFQGSEHVQQKAWTSLQFSGAMLVISDFLKTNYKKCENCGLKSPRITKPTFGWLHTTDVLGSRIRANVIKSYPLKGQFCTSNEEQCFLDPDSADTTSIHSSKTVRKNQVKQATDEFLKQKKQFEGVLLPSDVRALLKILWENEPRFCSFISDIHQAQRSGQGGEGGFSMFFLETLLVPPIRFRPPSKGGDSVMEHPQTVLLVKVVESNRSLNNAYHNKTGQSTIIKQWMNLQQSVNVLFGSKASISQGQKDLASGMQLLEKKEGVFRQKMMGKRVNYACRSVISPDPYLAVDEIGIPPYFALRLTYPERVTPWNAMKLREAIINGPDILPGATKYIDKITLKLPERKKRLSIARKLPLSRGVVTEPGKNCDYQFEGKMVYRHLQDGDIVLVNRQPTLHKPSMMAHRVRILPGEKTVRMHYSNCSTYNADFDGDEMNVHFPQDEISRSEGYNLVNANNQYIVPTRGDAKRGLIQDHIVSAVLLTKKDTFFTREEFEQLLYCCGVSSCGSRGFLSKIGDKVSLVTNETEMELILPAIWKPERRWTGKQVITAVLHHITRGHAPFSVEKVGKIPREYLASETGKRQSVKDRPEESTMFIFKNELVHGLIDQAQFGNYGLVHTVQELYGSNTAGALLSVFSRLFTIFLQMHGFTCGVDDLLILQSSDHERKRRLEVSERIGEEVHSDFLKLKTDQIDSSKLQMKVEEVIRSKGEAAVAVLDSMMSSKLSKASEINKTLLHRGLYKPFPKNCISLMTTSGAKGSAVNFSQISSFLGQQELEGKRVPRMISGKTLPCFLPWDCSSRAGGFISDRFLTGLRPQEYYFHCMAGREGLVDTAVKTSRSGYLQRCLIKNLECLKVCYDHTVRDADGSVIQFLYGEDGVDVHHVNFLEEHKAIAANQEMFLEKFGLKLGDARTSGIDSEINKLPYIAGLSEDVRKNFRRTSRNMVTDLPPGYNKEDIFNLMKHKYFSSLAQPGEPVGVIAAQSIGEPSTQMTLNTFHLAGRGEMNVTLGIPRLQEIIMTASSDIRTPIMSCPLQKHKTEYDGKRLAAKLKKISVADLIENVEVCLVPVALVDGEKVSIYKLKIKFYERECYHQFLDIVLEDCEETLEVVFLRALEDAIQSQVVMHSKGSGIITSVSQPNSSTEVDGDLSIDKLQEVKEYNVDDNLDENDDEDNGEEGMEDVGTDAEKRKQQAKDDIDYEDGDEDESDHETRMEIDHSGDGSENSEGEGDEATSDTEATESEKRVKLSMTKSGGKVSKSGEKVSKSGGKVSKSNTKGKKRTRMVRKDSDRSTFVAAKGVHFEAHFKFKNEPHILLAQIAVKAAQKVHIRSTGKIDRCDVIECKPDNVLPLHGANEGKQWGLQTAGVDFDLFWEMQDDLAINCIYTNNIHAMLNTYGVEAARSTVVREVQNVFKIYGVTVNPRHLTLIADFMTHSGGYRPMSRSGAISDSISPFGKMSFETASKFIVEAACHGLTDNMESPSARVCLGLPVKVGTGCFDVMQKIDV